MLRIAPWSAALILGGCATVLEPAPEADRVGRWGARAAEGGLEMVARAQAWQGMPANLGNQVTPMLVTVSNHGERAIRIAYENLRLVAASGRRYEALPPREIEGTVALTPEERDVPPGGSAYAPHAAAHFLGLLRRIYLPTADMLHRAFPEGALDPGRGSTGFVYFERVPPDAGRVELRAELPTVDGERVTRVEIPFETD